MQKPWKIFAKEYIFGKVVDSQPATLLKNETHYWYFQIIFLHLRNACFKVDLKEKCHNFYIQWILWYSKYLVLYFSRCSLYHKLIDDQLFYETKKNHLINTVCFRVRLIKEYMEITERKHTVESTMNGTWK